MDKNVTQFLSNKRIRSLYPLLIIDDERRITYANSAAYIFFKATYILSSEEMIEGRNLEELIPAYATRDHLQDQVFTTEIGGRSCYILPIFPEEQLIRGVRGIFIIDALSNEEYETELIYQRRLASNFRAILEGSFDGILVTDAEGKVLFVNSSYERVAEIKREEIMGKYMRELINPVWMPESVAHVVAREKKAVSIRQVTKSGKHIMVTGMPIIGPEGNIERIVINARDITEIYNLTEELQRAKETEKFYINRMTPSLVGTDDSDRKVLATSEEMKAALMLAEKVANFQVTVLITGESGVGKEEVAKFIHNKSLRKDKPFIVINCSAIPDTLLESELFGYEKGAFTGAMQSGKEGLLETAEGGTVFLDEIGDMPLDFQVKLLRFLESKEVRRVGAVDSKIVDVRVITATNRDLESLVKEGSFREDLYYRLNVVQIKVPPLRKRVDDILPLAALFLNRYNKKYGQEKQLTYDVVKELEDYSWPGNVRQLKNVIENLVITSDIDYLQVSNLPWKEGWRKNEVQKTIDALAQNQSLGLNDAVEALEKEMLSKAMRDYGSSRKIAEKLKVNQSTIIRKLHKYGLDKE
ncbi:MAG: sigma 54-interacting transcriptional regulator [Clostridia bacterium]|nr:sigma 54-interacting transcriptional regulator [Clostridia bacterium]